MKLQTFSSVNRSVKRLFWCAPIFGAFVLGGCGGLAFFGQIAGIIFDLNNDVVRDARVFVGDRETRSNSGGVFVLTQVLEGTRLVRAEVVKDGVNFSGENVARVFRSERSQNVNIVVSRTSQQGRVVGEVRDRFGSLVAGATVFALGNSLTSSMDITDGSGQYEIDGLAAGITYLLTASARTFNSDTTSVLLSAGQTRTLDFVLDDETNPTLPAPTNLDAVAWTTPAEPTREAGKAAAFEAIKQIIDPRRKARAPSRGFIGSNVEVDLFWDEMPSANYAALLGFGIYRSTTSFGQSTAIDFLRDPNAIFYADIDEVLFENEDYFYEITALNTSFPDFANSESDFSNRVEAITLGELISQPVSGPFLTFNWFAAAGAKEYSVFLFDEFPSIGVVPIWDSSATPTSGTSQAFTGSPLGPGTYYFIVLGQANGGFSRTLSDIGSFNVN